jgi:hemoglobin
MFEPKLDFEGRAEIEKLVNTFYDRVRSNEVLDHIFEKVAWTNRSTHLPKMYAFWETVLFRTADMAHVIYSKVNAVTDPRFDPPNLTPEQRERYSRYKAAS